MKIATIIVRLLLGLAFTVFGLNFFLNFIPQPPPPPGIAGDFVKVFAESHFLYAVGAMQLLSGLLLLIGRYVPLALTILAAVIYNILAFHILVSPGLSEMMPAIIVAALWAFLAWRYRDRFAGILSP